MKKTFTLFTLRLKGTKLFYTSRAFEADYYLPEDQSDVPRDLRKVDYPEHYVADEFAQAIRGEVPTGAFAKEAKSLLASELTRAIMKPYAHLENEGVVAYKILTGTPEGEDHRVYAQLRLELERAVFEKKADLSQKIIKLLEEQNSVDKLIERAVRAKRPKLDGGQGK